MTKVESKIRVLDDAEIEFVSGGAAPTLVDQKGYGAPRLNMSPFGMTTPFDANWALVGVTGHP